MADKKKSNNLDDILKNINKKYGSDTATFVDKKENTKIETFSTNCFSFDKIFGCGGVPVGRVIDMYGEYSSGKSTMAMYVVAQIQKQGGNAVWIDTEYAFTSDYAEKVGVDVSKLVLVQPSNGEQALNILTEFVNSSTIDIVVLDSTGALVPSKEMEENIEDHNMALQARMISKCLRIITAPAAKNKTTVVFISQLRSKIGSFVGPTTDSTGGKALKFYSSVRLNVQKIKTLKDKADSVIGNRLRIEASKNKVGKPFRKVEINLYFEKGLDVDGDIFDVAVDLGIIKKEGMTFFYGKEKLGVGRDNALEFASSDKKMFDKIREDVYKKDKELNDIGGVIEEEPIEEDKSEAPDNNNKSVNDVFEEVKNDGK